MAVLLVFSAAAFSDSVYKANASAGYASVQLESYARQVAGIVNRERVANGLSPLRYSDKLSQAALVRADEIQSVFSHTRPNGTRCFTVLSEAGVSYSSAGENIAYGQRDPEDVMHSWMNSSGHRANILGKDFAYIGVGVVYENGTYYWTQFFAASDDLSGEVVTTASTAAPTTVPSMTTTVPVTTVSTTSSETVSREETEPTSAVYPREIAGEAPCDETADGCGEDRGDRIRTLVNLLREKLLRQNGSCQ